MNKKTKVAVLIAAGTGMGADAAKKLSTNGFNISILSSSGKGEKLAKEFVDAKKRAGLGEYCWARSRQKVSIPWNKQKNKFSNLIKV